MPRTIKPRSGWRAAALITPIKLKAKDADRLCRAAGLDPSLTNTRRRCHTLLGAVAEAIGQYRDEVADQKQAPLPTHQRAALHALQAAIETLTSQIHALDDASRERLTVKRRIPPSSPKSDVERPTPGGVRDGVDFGALEQQLDYLHSTVLLALGDLAILVKRGRVKNTPRRTLLSLLARAFSAGGGDPDEADPDEFLQIPCEAAGIRLTDTQAQAFVAQSLR
jgi:hypothetical protein